MTLRRELLRPLLPRLRLRKKPVIAAVTVSTCATVTVVAFQVVGSSASDLARSRVVPSGPCSGHPNNGSR